jgi:hypothetical protein
MKGYFCWRCNKKMPFLEEDEWQQISPLLKGTIEAIKDYRKKHKCDRVRLWQFTNLQVLR